MEPNEISSTFMEKPLINAPHKPISLNCLPVSKITEFRQKHNTVLAATKQNQNENENISTASIPKSSFYNINKPIVSNILANVSTNNHSDDMKIVRPPLMFLSSSNSSSSPQGSLKKRFRPNLEDEDNSHIFNKANNTFNENSNNFNSKNAKRHLITARTNKIGCLANEKLASNAFGSPSSKLKINDRENQENEGDFKLFSQSPIKTSWNRSNTSENKSCGKG